MPFSSTSVNVIHFPFQSFFSRPATRHKTIDLEGNGFPQLAHDVPQLAALLLSTRPDQR